MDEYLRDDEVIDSQHPAVMAQARELAAGADDSQLIAQRCFHFVRDTIRHSFDPPYEAGAAVACAASEVLRLGHGICYAKSHLLAALLRANGIPAGFDYQRLSDDQGGFVLHGLNTVHLEGIGWYRLDARGNKAGVSAHFRPPEEQLAWAANGPGECDYRLNLVAPLVEVVTALRHASCVDELRSELPSSVRMG